MNLQKKLNDLFSSLQSQLFLFFAIIAIILSIIKYRKIIVVIAQIILYYLIAEEIHCKLHGNCVINSWIITIIPIIGIIIFIIDYMNVLTHFKLNLIKLFTFYERIDPEGKLDMKINNNNIPL